MTEKVVHFETVFFGKTMSKVSQNGGGGLISAGISYASFVLVPDVELPLNKSFNDKV
jgi:hypothetical protein